MFGLPNPTEIITGIADDRQKRAVIGLSVDLSYSMVITFLYSLGEQLSARKMIGWLGYPFMQTAAAAYILLLRQKRMKLMDLGVPKNLVENSALHDSIHWDDARQG